ncbi:MAG: class I SAM-dependent RNA methyltransferase [Candidatus Omnitrophica bacterium]|nr:class I SAM-dependent RNA methyltransferase [Candidatus Omnitrophota bacterium]
MSEETLLKTERMARRIEPLCPAYGICGGCAYQEIPYPEELGAKENRVHKLFRDGLGVGAEVLKPIQASPKPYYYRNRVDLTLRRLKSGEIIMGFQHENSHQVVRVDSCDLAMPVISDAFPGIQEEASRKLPGDYRTANLVIKSGDDGRVLWGGIGRHSCRLEEKDYLWAEIKGKRFFYSLDTFFQANLTILPKLMEVLEEYLPGGDNALLYDLYAGVGFFGLYFASRFRRVFLIEESDTSCDLMKFNLRYHGLPHVEAIRGKVEHLFPGLLSQSQGRHVAMIDPPRRGLSDETRAMLAKEKRLEALVYLSCNPETLVRDLKDFLEEGWSLKVVIPFDFFPRTKHIETLTLLHQEPTAGAHRVGGLFNHS